MSETDSQTETERTVFDFDQNTDSPDVFVTETFVNEYDDERAVLAGDTYEHKDTIKFDWHTTHHEWDGDNWVVDADALPELAEKLIEEGASVSFGDDTEGGKDRELVDLYDHVEEGDRLRVTYQKKTGNGTSEYVGDVIYKEQAPDTPRVVFNRDDDQTMYLRYDQYGKVALFTAKSHAPFVGAVETVEVSE